MRNTKYSNFQAARRGNVTVLVAVCLTGILGVTAIAVDGGLLLANRRAAQAAADAGALAAAIQTFTDWPSQTSVQQGLDPSGTARSSRHENRPR